MPALALAAAVVFVAALQPGPAEERISQAETKALFAAKRVLLVDTRDEDAFKRGHIPGARSLPDGELSAATPAAEKTIAALAAAKLPVIVYCACPAEITSLRVARVLRARGIHDARALAGGWVEWFNAGNPVDSAR